MKKKQINFELTIFDSDEELSKEEQHLLMEAHKARHDAYAPYSNFQVGAAVLMENGEIVIGSNQENAAYPAGLCAERVAIFYAGAKYPNTRIKSIAITASSKEYKVEVPAAPCGSCRQAISEYEQKQKTPIAILLQGEEGLVYKCNSVADILPLAFNNSFLRDS